MKVVPASIIFTQTCQWELNILPTESERVYELYFPGDLHNLAPPLLDLTT